MSAPLCVLLTPEAVYAWPRGGAVPDAGARAGGIRWSPDAPGALVETLRARPPVGPGVSAGAVQLLRRCVKGLHAYQS